MKTRIEILLDELEECKKSYAYQQNHLLDTIIARVKELINKKEATEIKIGF